MADNEQEAGVARMPEEFKARLEYGKYAHEAIRKQSGVTTS
jgi:hypothetical protein